MPGGDGSGDSGDRGAGGPEMGADVDLKAELARRGLELAARLDILVFLEECNSRTISRSTAQAERARLERTWGIEIDHPYAGARMTDPGISLWRGGA